MSKCDTCKFADLRKGAWWVCNLRSYTGGMADRLGPPVCEHDPDNKKLPSKWKQIEE